MKKYKLKFNNLKIYEAVNYNESGINNINKNKLLRLNITFISLGLTISCLIHQSKYKTNEKLKKGMMIKINTSKHVNLNYLLGIKRSIYVFITNHPEKDEVYNSIFVESM
mmetsp:Transcript_4466/g.10516  ORF Transcript_4466/g.10516 Transcript_4466/m.10516 type:complete len:110 (-) Transcript_4466:549-878(-)